MKQCHCRHEREIAGCRGQNKCPGWHVIFATGKCRYKQMPTEEIFVSISMRYSEYYSIVCKCYSDINHFQMADLSDIEDQIDTYQHLVFYEAALLELTHGSIPCRTLRYPLAEIILNFKRSHSMHLLVNRTVTFNGKLLHDKSSPWVSMYQFPEYHCSVLTLSFFILFSRTKMVNCSSDTEFLSKLHCLRICLDVSIFSRLSTLS